jgi:hypothetical protein
VSGNKTATPRGAGEGSRRWGRRFSRRPPSFRNSAFDRTPSHHSLDSFPRLGWSTALQEFRCKNFACVFVDVLRNLKQLINHYRLKRCNAFVPIQERRRGEGLGRQRLSRQMMRGYCSSVHRQCATAARGCGTGAVLPSMKPFQAGRDRLARRAGTGWPDGPAVQRSLPVSRFEWNKGLPVLRLSRFQTADLGGRFSG